MGLCPFLKHQLINKCPSPLGMGPSPYIQPQRERRRGKSLIGDVEWGRRTRKQGATNDVSSSQLPLWTPETSSRWGSPEPVDHTTPKVPAVFILQPYQSRLKACSQEALIPALCLGGVGLVARESPRMKRHRSWRLEVGPACSGAVVTEGIWAGRSQNPYFSHAWAPSDACH